MDIVSTMEHVHFTENQGRFNLLVRAGLFQYDLNIYPNRNYASGSYALVINGVPRETKFKEIDSKISPGAEISLKYPSYLMSIIYTATPFNGFMSRLGFSLKAVFGWRSPLLEEGSVVEILFFRTTHFSKFTFSLNFHLIDYENQEFISPYIAVRVGLENYHYFQEYNTDKQHYIPIFEVEGGLQFLLPQFILKNNLKYGLRVGACYRDAMNGLHFSDRFFINVAVTIAADI